MIIAIWMLVAILAVVTLVAFDNELALTGFGAILAAAAATVSLIHLFRAAPENFVTELVYVSGGSYLILALASVYVFIRG
ncbi:MAG: hypothetical protein RL670_1259 [Actinomycetota bacterium]|jgi:hypothetical protein